MPLVEPPFALFKIEMEAMFRDAVVMVAGFNKAFRAVNPPMMEVRNIDCILGTVAIGVDDDVRRDFPLHSVH